MLPSDLRFSTLMRGLEEKDDTQLRLAAAVGIQFTSKALIDRAPVAELAFRVKLLQYTRQSQPALWSVNCLVSSTSQRLRMSYLAVSAGECEIDNFLAFRAFMSVRSYLQHPRDTKFVLCLLVRADN
jgi:hypothetical protein